MRIAVSGSTGLVGSALRNLLADTDHDVIPLVRPGASAPEGSVRWDPSGEIEVAGLEGLDGVVHLAGENIAGGRWTAVRKRRIRESRVYGTRALASAIARLANPPGVLVCASAIGYYGDRGDEVLREDSAPGTSFLSHVCQEWEKASEPATQAGVRVVNLRFGVILSRLGGALAKMLPPFRLGVGGRIGSGRQQMSWLSIDDAVGIVAHVLRRDGLRGAVNAVSPSPVTNAEFTRILGRVLSRPTPFPMPAFAARLAFGEMADELLLASTRVEPARLRTAGYGFLHSDLETALRHVLGRPAG